MRRIKSRAMFPLSQKRIGEEKLECQRLPRCVAFFFSLIALVLCRTQLKIHSYFSAKKPIQQKTYGPPTAPAQTFVAPQMGYGVPHMAYGTPITSYGAPQSSYGTPQSSYGAPQSTYGLPESRISGSASQINPQFVSAPDEENLVC